MKGAPSSYGELAVVLENLPLLLAENRRRLGLSLRAAGAEAGVPFTTLARIERGEPCASTTLVPLLLWLGKR